MLSAGPSAPRADAKMEEVQDASSTDSEQPTTDDASSVGAAAGAPPPGPQLQHLRDSDACRDVEDVQNCLSNAKRFPVKAQECKDIITQFQHVCSAKCCIEMMQTTVESGWSTQEITQLKGARDKWIDDIKAHDVLVVQDASRTATTRTRTVPRRRPRWS